MTTANTDKTASSGVVVVKNFFAAFGKGDVEGVISSFSDNAEITAVRKASRTPGDVFGSYSGKSGVREFIANLGNAFDTKSFTVQHVIGEKEIVFANGSFTHILKKSGKPYSSDWSLMATVKSGQIVEYHFYEDSAGFERAK